jgi:hypothetical protein
MDAAPTPLVLEYAAATPSSGGRRGDVLFLILGLPALVAVFAPFTFGVSPARVFVEFRRFAWNRWEPEMAILLLAIPFVLPAAAWVLRLRAVVRGPATRAERAIGLLVASLGAATVATLLAITGVDPDEWSWETLVTLGPAAFVLCGGAALLAVLWRRRAAPDLRVRVALHAPYVANSAIALVAFWDERQSGWYLTAFAAAAALTELVAIAAGQFRPGRRG